jgi:hypothetical protein
MPALIGVIDEAGRCLMLEARRSLPPASLWPYRLLLSSELQAVDWNKEKSPL